MSYVRVHDVAPEAVRRWLETGRDTDVQSGAWQARLFTRDGGKRATIDLWHYRTLMASIDVDGQGTFERVHELHLGWGSKTDQNGMNALFRAFGMPYRFDRDQRGGGPRIEELERV